MEHARYVPRARGRRGGVSAYGRANSATQHGGDASVQRDLNLLRSYEVDVRVYAASGDDLAFSGDDLCAWADYDVHVGLNVVIPRLAYGSN